MGGPDQMKFEILADGTIKVETVGTISAVNHVNAEEFLKLIHQLTGGDVTIEHKRSAVRGQPIAQHQKQGQ